MRHGKEKVKGKLIVNKILKEPIIYLLVLIAIIQGIVYSNMPTYGETGDSNGYLHVYDSKSILKGYINESRPPVYPYLIRVIRKVAGEENLEVNIAKVQKFIFFISIILFYCILKMLIKNKLIISILTLIFGITPSILIWNVYIVTEALTCLEILILTYITVKYLKKPSRILSSLMGIVILLMILAKPALIYFLPIYILFIVLRYILEKKERKTLLFGIGSLVICCLVLVIYCCQIKNLYGVFGLTNISGINNVLSVLDSGAYEEIQNNPITETIMQYVDEPISDNKTYEINGELEKKYSKEELNEYTNLAMKTKRYEEYMFNKIISLGSENIGTAHPMGEPENENAINNLSSISRLLIPITFGFIYIIILISIVYLIWYLIKYKKINWICAFFTSTIFANLFTFFVGAPFEPQRLFFPSMCLVLLYIGTIIGKIKLKEENLLDEKAI